MGLDMYLKATRYVSGWKHSKPDPMFGELVEMTGLTPHEESPSFTVSVTVGYWRKANAIHAWFVKHVQDGKDDCQTVDVGREQLAKLRDDCNKVLAESRTTDGQLNAGTTYHGDGRITHHKQDGKVIANPEVAASILPTKSGFFFGGTDYDEWYLDDLRKTVAIIDSVLSNPKLEDWCFEYRASW